ncbi:hypothetical protein ACFL02_10280 [Planctomycetota bacterium]
MSRSEEEFKKIFDKAQVDTRPDPVYRRNLHRQMLLTFEAQKQKPDTVETPASQTKQSLTIKLKERLITMKNITKIAATFIIVAGIIGMIVVFTHTGKPSFAEIVKPLLARTVTYKVTVYSEGQPTQSQEHMFMAPARLRQNTPDRGVMIIDYVQGKSLALMEKQKIAVQVDMENMPDYQMEQEIIFFKIRDVMQQAQQNEALSVELLGEKQIDGRPAEGYQTSLELLDIIVWADTETQQPLRIEVTMEGLLGKEIRSVMYDFAFDVDLDPSLFSLEPPEDYKVISQTVDASLPAENDLINLLALAKDIPGNEFPAAISMKATREFFAPLRSMIKGRNPDDVEPEQLQEFIALFLPITRGLTFLQTLPAESDWHYNGKGVKVGQPDTPIFWYKPEVSDTYRVIYADLTVRDLSDNQLPDAPDAQTKDSQKSVLDVPEVIKK